MVPHSYTLKYDEEVFGIRKLTEEQKKEAGKRIKALEKRDEDKLKTDEAKNDYESAIYEFRGWLNEDENSVYITESQREQMLETTEKAEDWLYDDGSDAGYKEF